MLYNKKILFVVMFFLVIVVCLMSVIESKDGTIPEKQDILSSGDNIEDSNKELTTEDLDDSLASDNNNEETDILIENILASMTLEEKAAQIFFIKNDGRLDASILDEYPVGGIILFASDFEGETPDSLKEKIASFQNNSELPLLIGVDEEGGQVIRVSNYSALADYAFKSPKELYNQGGYDAICEDANFKSQLLLSYGINVNFAPVCDVSDNPSDYIYERSFGGSAEETAEYVSVVVAAMDDAGIGNVLKHFPGYGSNGDTQMNIVRDTRTYDEFKESDFIPFTAGIEAGADCVLVSHNIVECIDSEWPASLSDKVINVLRNDMGFDGVIITDDLMMNGVSNYVSDEESVVRAIQAGNDMIISTDFQVQYQAVLKALEEGTITEERLDESIRRILKWKYELGLIE